jgi:predicted metal-dependent phosphoesterase TrpH
MSSGIRLDLHVHSRHSPDSRLDLETIVERVALAGLEGFALTDHNTVEGHAELAELTPRHPKMWFLPGVEVSTREGHLLVYGVGETPPVGRPLGETLDWVRARRAVAVLAHPFRWAHGAGRRAANRAAVDGIEAVNGRTALVGNVQAELIGARRNLSLVGGSDAHEPEDVGRAFTEFPMGLSAVPEFLAALRDHRAHAGGDSLALGGRIRVTLRNALLRAGRGFRPV